LSEKKEGKETSPKIEINLNKTIWIDKQIQTNII